MLRLFRQRRAPVDPLDALDTQYIREYEAHEAECRQCGPYKPPCVAANRVLARWTAARAQLGAKPGEA